MLGQEYDLLGRFAAASPVGPPLRVDDGERAGDQCGPRRAAAALRAVDADLIAVQELGEPMGRDLAALLAAAYPHQVLYPDASGYLGMGVFSRYPLTAALPLAVEGGKLLLPRRDGRPGGRGRRAC